MAHDVSQAGRRDAGPARRVIAARVSRVISRSRRGMSSRGGAPQNPAKPSRLATGSHEGPVPAAAPPLLVVAVDMKVCEAPTGDSQVVATL